MKRFLALLLALWLLATACTVSADTTSAMEGNVTQAETITQTTAINEEIEVLEKVSAAVPDGTALALIVLGGVMIVLAIVLLCVFLFAFPRWGLMKNPPVVVEEADDVPPTDDVSEEASIQTPSVRLEDLF